MKKYNSRKKVVIVTSSRADYSILRNLILILKNSKKVDFKLIVTGQHLSKKYGNTSNEILNELSKKDIIKIKLQVNKTNPKSIARMMENSLRKFTSLLVKNKFDLMILLGDRYETVSIALAALLSKIPLAHINGGEKTIGSNDDIFRHCITKMSNYHFVSCDKYFKRILQLGEPKKNIFNVGSLGVEAFKEKDLLSKEEIEDNLKINFSSKNYLVCINSTTYGNENMNFLLKNLFFDLNRIKDCTIIFTLPNSDLNSDNISYKIKNFCKNKKNVFYFKNLGHRYYKSVLNNCNIIIGNSSSGVIEAPSIGIPTINIGIRQKGRERTSSILDCEIKKNEIFYAIKKIEKHSFMKKNINKKSKNFLYKKNSSNNIYKIILKILRSNHHLKEFNDLF